jgi:beta-aspartyl-peptidase (threonine type)
MEKALHAGYKALLREKGTSLDAVEAAIRVLEDSPLYNAGKGAVFTSEGRNELDASIMEGKQLRAGAVAGVTIIKNPITAARAVMEKSKHVLLTGRGAELFATQQNLDIVDPSYFWTLKRWNELKEAQQKEKDEKRKKSTAPARPRYFGTVGAVALDRNGNLAAGTSTGGMTNKRTGRLGDSPIIGAGTYADNEACGVSCTGHGEFFIRYAVSHDIAALVKYKGLSVQEAADEVVQKKLKKAGGEGAVIVLDTKGNVAVSFNSERMFRGWITMDGKVHIVAFHEKPLK